MEIRNNKHYVTMKITKITMDKTHHDVRKITNEYNDLQKRYTGDIKIPAKEESKTTKYYMYHLLQTAENRETLKESRHDFITKKKENYRH